MNKTTLLLLASILLISCNNLPSAFGRYSNISTSGVVYGPNGAPVENMIILIQSDNLAINDTAFTDKDGRFFRATKHVPYPFPEVKVIAIDFNEVLQPYSQENKYLSDTLTTGYTFFCGTNAPPVEKDWAFNSEDLSFYFGLSPMDITTPEQAVSCLQGTWVMTWEECYGYNDYHEKYGYTNGYSDAFEVENSPLEWSVSGQTIVETHVVKGDTVVSTKPYSIEKSTHFLEPFAILVSNANESDYGKTDNVIRLKFLSTAAIEINFSRRDVDGPQYIRRLQRIH